MGLRYQINLPTISVTTDLIPMQYSMQLCSVRYTREDVHRVLISCGVTRCDRRSLTCNINISCKGSSLEVKDLAMSLECLFVCSV